MVKLPEPDKRNIITRAPFVDDMVGEMIAHLYEGNPLIAVEIKPFDSDMYARFDMNPRDARQLAEQLRDMADVAQRAMWTSKLIAHVRERYLPGTSDEEIIHRLDRLVERDGSIELRRSGLLRPDDGHKLVADAHRELVDRVADSLASAGVGLSDLAGVVDDLKKVDETETEPDE